MPDIGNVTAASATSTDPILAPNNGDAPQKKADNTSNSSSAASATTPQQVIQAHTASSGQNTNAENSKSTDCSGKKAQTTPCQLTKQWKADHQAHSVSQGKTTTIVHSDGSLERRTGSIAYRDNNPGNLRPADGQNRIGVDHPAQKGGKRDKVGFSVFENGADGDNALRALLKSPKVQSRTIAEEMRIYAPASDRNNPKAYAETLAKNLGVSADTKISDLTPAQFEALVRAIKQQEGAKGKSETIKQ